LIVGEHGVDASPWVDWFAMLKLWCSRGSIGDTRGVPMMMMMMVVVVMAEAESGGRRSRRSG